MKTSEGGRGCDMPGVTDAGAATSYARVEAVVSEDRRARGGGDECPIATGPAVRRADQRHHSRRAPGGRAGVVASWADDRLGLGTINRADVLAPQGLPRPLVVPAGRDRAVELRRPAGHRGLPDPVVRPEHDRGDLPGLLRPAARRTHVRSVRVDARHLLRRPRRAAAPADAPLGGAHLHRGDADPPVAARAHRQLPQAPGDQLGHRVPDAAARHRRGVRRLLATRRPALRHRPPRRRRVPEGHPGGRHLPVVPAVRRRVPRATPRSRGCSSCTSC